MSKSKLFVASLLAAVGAGSAGAQDHGLFRIGTGGPGGNYLPVGAALAGVISPSGGAESCEPDPCGVPGLQAVAETTAASVYNNAAVQSGELDAGLTTADVLLAMFEGTGEFEGRPHGKLRILTALFESQLHVVMPAGSAIGDLGDLAGMRVGIAESGSGTQVTVLELLGLWGVSRDDIDAAELNVEDSAAALRDGELDAFFYFLGWPADAIARLAEASGISLHSFDDEEMEIIHAAVPTLVPSAIPEGAYSGMEEAAAVPGVPSYMVVSSDVPEAVVYEVTRAIFSPHARKVLDRSHRKARLITLESALDGIGGIGIPLHPGAERFYRETGILP